jgi:hypothetical protein
MLGAWYTYVAQFENLCLRGTLELSGHNLVVRGTARERERQRCCSINGSLWPPQCPRLYSTSMPSPSAHRYPCVALCRSGSGTQSISIAHLRSQVVHVKTLYLHHLFPASRIMQHPELETFCTRQLALCQMAVRPIAHATSIMHLILIPDRLRARQVTYA